MEQSANQCQVEACVKRADIVVQGESIPVRTIKICSTHYMGGIVETVDGKVIARPSVK